MNPLLKSITRDLNATMKAAGVTKAELSRRLKVHPAQVTRFCNGKHNLNILTLHKIAGALGCEVKVTFNKG